MEAASRVQVHEITVPRTSRYAVLGHGVSAVDEVWLVCHGYGQLAARFIRRFETLENDRRLIVAPEALSRFYLSGSSGPHAGDAKVGASWMTREWKDAEIADQVTYLDLVRDKAWGALSGSARLVALGFSQGAAAVCRWAAATRMPPDNVVLWGSGVPDDLLIGEGLEGLRRASVTIVVGESDPVANPAQVAAHRQQLATAGVAYRFVSYQGGHEIDPAVLLDIAGQLQTDRVVSRAKPTG